MWGVHVTLEHVNGDTTTSGTASGEISAALRRALRDALGDRTASRVRKALRRCGLINRAAVFEHEHTARGVNQRPRIHVTQLEPSAAIDGDVAALICERTRGLPIRAPRLMPGFDVTLGDCTLVPNPFWDGVLFPTVVMLVMALWPWIERRVTGDRAGCNPLDARATHRAARRSASRSSPGRAHLPGRLR